MMTSPIRSTQPLLVVPPATYAQHQDIRGGVTGQRSAGWYYRGEDRAGMPVEGREGS